MTVSAGPAEGPRVPGDVSQAITSAGVWPLWVPHEVGGTEADPLTALRAIAELSSLDGSTGWNAAISVGTSLLVGHITEQAARDMFAEGPDVPFAGVLTPRGRAVAVDGGYRVSGRWPFASGCEYSFWFCAACHVSSDDSGSQLPEGSPETALMFVPKGSFKVVRNWDTIGLRGTGSHDVEIDQAFVPARLAARFVRPSWPEGPLYRLPFVTLATALIAAVPLGIARAALEDTKRLARENTSSADGKRLAEHSVLQSQIAEAEGRLRSARAFLENAVGEIWDSVVSGGEASSHDRTLLRLSAVHSSSAAASVVDMAYHAAGSAALYETSPLQRQFRDVHAATQHAALARASFESIGRALLGLDRDS